MIVLDELGYKEAYVGEHFTFTWENIPSPDLFIAKAAAMTENIIFGTGITCMPIHNPAVVAHRIAQLDHQTHGRFHWGVGSSSTPSDAEMFMAGEDRRRSTREGIDAVLKIWTDPEPGHYKTDFWEFKIPELPSKHCECPHETLSKTASTNCVGRVFRKVGHANLRW